MIAVCRDGEILGLDGEGRLDRDDPIDFLEGQLEGNRLEMDRDGAAVDPGHHQKVVDETLESARLAARRC